MRLYFKIHEIAHGRYKDFTIPYVRIWTKAVTNPTPRWVCVHGSYYNNLLKKL